MELKVSKGITCKWQNQRSLTNKYVSWALFLKLQAAGINFEKLLGWTVFKNPNFNEGDIGGFWTPQYRKKIRQIPQHLNTESKTRCNKSVLCMSSANNIEITMKYYLLTESEVITGKSQTEAFM